MSEELKENTMFLNKQLALWKSKVSKRKKWTNLVRSYEEKYNELKRRLDEILNVFDDNDIKLLTDTFQEYYELSQGGDIKFFKSFENKETIEKVFGDDHFKNNIGGYKDTYIYEKVKDAEFAFKENMKIFNNDSIKSFHAVGNWKKSDPQNLKHNSGKSKGAMLQYLIIEYLADVLEDFDKTKLIKFYDLSINILWTPHSIKNAIGLHYNVNNNNFILQLLEFYKKISDSDNNEWKGYLNAVWPSGDNKNFTRFDKNSVIELHSWINLGKQQGDSIVSIYNDKTVKTLQALMNNKKDVLSENDFYKLYKEYIDKKPYPSLEPTEVQKVIYADQFFQYIHELEIEEMHKNIIYYGAPGTGKTHHVTKQFIDFHDVKDTNFILIQFHPSYGYEDFIEGIKPKGISKDDNIRFDLVNGEFKQFCIDASQKPNENFYFIVDEINRAELSRTFGELLYCLEYRVKFEGDGTIDFTNNKTNLIRTQYSNLIDTLENRDELSLIVNKGKSYFGVPDNIYFIGTMNDIDRSIDSFDMALRRRFIWKRMDCNLEVVEEWLYDNKIDNSISLKYIDACEKLNNYIVKELKLSSSYQIGHAYFMKLPLEIDSNNLQQIMLDKLWDSNLKPLLFEYLRAEYPENEIINKLETAKDIFKLD